MNAKDFKKELHKIVDEQSQCNIPDWHKTIIEERSKAYNRNPESAISWAD